MLSFLKILNEIFPLVTFFVLYKTYDMIIATMGISIASVVSLLINYKIEKKMNIVPLISTAMLIGIALFSYLSNDPNLIKLKPTFLNLLFAIALLVGIVKGKGFIKYLFGSAFEMSEEQWIALSKRWMMFFITMAVANEIVWRNFDENIWVNFKVFGMLPMTIAFAASQMPYIMKNSKNKLEQSS
ncbi:MAG: septation protein IspZ [Alphaproteobacteria bacterium]|nr:septation protein IspZ [Alphaproteobacteria bacterium]OJV13587.1 MAG: hypothetical protein BGO27_03115 [Alphaproteobacteria bacterium 33-17]